MMRQDLYRECGGDPGSVRASLDVVSQAGIAEGWALYTRSLAICHIQIKLNDVLLGEDMADKFRPDLFDAGLRHGHCAFYAEIPDTPNGTHSLRLIDGRTGRSIDHIGRQNVVVPRFERQSGIPRHGASWSDQQIMSRPNFLQLDSNYARLGADRYVDVVFRFVLGRWADPRAIESYGSALRSGAMTPTEVLVDVLGSTERKGQRRSLPTVFEADFLFDMSIELPEEHNF